MKIIEFLRKIEGCYWVSERASGIFWFIPYLGETKISKDMTPLDILERLYSKGWDDGIKEGKIERSNEFKQLLNLKNE